MKIESSAQNLVVKSVIKLWNKKYLFFKSFNDFLCSFLRVLVILVSVFFKLLIIEVSFVSFC